MKKKTKIILSIQSDTKCIKGDIHTKATLQFSKKEKVTMNMGIFIM